MKETLNLLHVNSTKLSSVILENNLATQMTSSLTRAIVDAVCYV